MSESPPIVDLLAVPQAERNLDWLKAALQTAARLEFATIPPYLCAMWSIKSGNGPAYDQLREVVMEEMLHLGLVSNMLTTIGDTPRLFPDAAPAYPCHLPGGVRPSLVVPLQRLSPGAIKDVFMEIEKPRHDISGLDPTDETDTTIGDFYDAILGAFEALPAGAITGQRQLTKMIKIRTNVKANMFQVVSIDDVRKAIHTIKEQGEGSSTSPFEMSKGIAMDAAHYFRFAELYKGKELDFDNGAIVFTGAEIPFPDVFPMALIPAGGHQGPGLPEDVAATLLEFDQTYTTMLKQLQAAWEPSPADPALAQPAKLNASIATMFSMTEIARTLMDMEISPGGETYGPCFRISESPG